MVDAVTFPEFFNIVSDPDNVDYEGYKYISRELEITVPIINVLKKLVIAYLPCAYVHYDSTTKTVHLSMPITFTLRNCNISTTCSDYCEHATSMFCAYGETRSLHTIKRCEFCGFQMTLLDDGCNECHGTECLEINVHKHLSSCSLVFRYYSKKLAALCDKEIAYKCDMCLEYDADPSTNERCGYRWYTAMCMDTGICGYRARFFHDEPLLIEGMSKKLKLTIDSCTFQSSQYSAFLTPKWTTKKIL